jgi:hypothetical protein
VALDGGGRFYAWVGVGERGGKPSPQFVLIFRVPKRDVRLMKMYGVIVDKRPEWCLYCPLMACAVKIGFGECGEKKTVDMGDGWTHGGKAPDSRCLLVEEGR